MQTHFTNSQGATTLTTSTRFSLYPWFVLVCTSCFFFYEFAQLNIFNAIDEQVRISFSLNASDLGRFSAFYADANLLFLFPAGLLLDRFSARNLIILAMLVCSGATYAFAHAHSLWIAELCRFLTGMGGSFCLLACLRLASRWFTPKHMALASGIIVTLGMAGGAVAQAPFTYLVENYGWRQAMTINAFVGLAIILIILAIVRDYPPTEQQHYESDHNKLHQLGFWRSIVLALSNRQNFLCGVYTSLLNLPVALLGAIWGVPYLQTACGLTRDQASLVTMMIFIGTLIGSPTVGWISDKIARRKLPMLIGGILSLAFILLVMYIPFHSYLTYMILFLALGFITSSQVISYPLIAESNPSFLTGTSTSIASILILGGYAFFQPIFGKLMDLNWHGHLEHGVRHYSPSDFTLPMLVFPAAFAVGIVITFFIRETYCRSVEELKSAKEI
ncbi:MAG: MFS transporter [Legionellales bacterium]|nr:MFS transporter [Legionellales bacterium]